MNKRDLGFQRILRRNKKMPFFGEIVTSSCCNKYLKTDNKRDRLVIIGTIFFNKIILIEFFLRG
jgi:hypothetical protein